MKTKVELRGTLPTKSSTRKTAVVDCILPKLNYTQGIGASRYTTLELDRDSLITVDEMDLNLTKTFTCSTYKNGKIDIILHEMRHYKQKLIIEKNLPHPLKDLLKENLSNLYIPEYKTDNDQMCKYTLQPIELDAFAYTKYFFKEYLNQDLIIFHQTIEVLFDMYIEKFLNTK